MGASVEQLGACLQKTQVSEVECFWLFLCDQKFILKSLSVFLFHDILQSPYLAAQLEQAPTFLFSTSVGILLF